MKIVFVGTFGFSPKSTIPVRAVPLARELVRQGHQVVVLLPPWDNPDDSGRSWNIDGVTIKNVALPPRIPLLWYLLLGWRLLQATLAEHPDAVHAFKPKGFSGVVAQVLLLRLGLARPRVFVDTDDWEGPGGWNDRNDYPRWQRMFFAYQERWLLRHADAVTAASTALVALAEAHRIGSDGIVYVPNGGVPVAPVAEAERAALRKRLGLGVAPVLLLYTRFVECPPQRFMGLLQKVVACGERPAVLLVGTALNGEEEVFLHEAAAAELPLQIIPVGWVPVEELPLYLSLADVALFPMEDNLINRTKCSAKLLDLLGAGVPVVAEAVGQNREYIVDGESGVLAPPGDDDAFAKAAVALLRDAERRQRLGAAARQRMEQLFRWERLVTPLVALYESAGTKQ